LFGATPGMTQAGKTEEAEPPDDLMTLEEQASEDAKRHKRALGEVEVEEDKKRREAEAAAAELWTWRKELDKEKDKRRDLEEQMDDLKLEVGFNREACAKATHAIGKLVASQLQEAEKSDQATIMVVKKKSEKMKSFFDSYRVLQDIVARESILVSVSNNGPMLAVKVVTPEKVRDAMNLVHKWQQDEKLDAAVFRGKTSLTQMVELPIRGAHKAMLQQMNMDPRQGKEAGLSTCWMDQSKKWSICIHDVCYIRGCMNMDSLECEVQISLEHFTTEAAEKVKRDMKTFESGDRGGSIFEQSFKTLDCFTRTGPGVFPWGRQSKGGGGKGGKGTGKNY